MVALAAPIKAPNVRDRLTCCPAIRAAMPSFLAVETLTITLDFTNLRS